MCTTSKKCDECAAKEKRIRHEGGRYALYSKDGSKKLAEHLTMRAAEEHRDALDARLARA